MIIPGRAGCQFNAAGIVFVRCVKYVDCLQCAARITIEAGFPVDDASNMLTVLLRCEAIAELAVFKATFLSWWILTD